MRAETGYLGLLFGLRKPSLDGSQRKTRIKSRTFRSSQTIKSRESRIKLDGPERALDEKKGKDADTTTLSKGTHCTPEVNKTHSFNMVLE